MGRLVRETDGMENTTTHYIFDEEEGALKGTLKYMHHRTIEGQAIQYLSYAYDGFARLVRTTEQRPSGTYITDLEYDECSRISTTTYPTGVSIKNEYGNGYLRRILDADGHVLWKTNGINAYGQLTDAMLGNGTTTHRAYKEDMHYLDSIVTSNNLQNLSYSYDKFGNLASRKDNLRNLEETFQYDKMNRLTDICLGNTHSQIVYDALSRMTSKQADGQTVFANADFTGVPGQPVRPHAMKSAATADGVFPTASQTITYTSFDKVKSIGEDGKGLVYTYGYDHQRIRAFEAFSDHTVNKDYVGVCEYITEDHGAGGATFKTLTYLVGPYGVFAVVEKQNNEESIHYILKDHLGSWTTITDSEGNVEQELSFDAWGNLRNPDAWTGAPTETPLFDRGYTGHEHLYDFGLINMNGRMYDPLMSSFLSVDRYVQSPENSQNFNRYAYCLNNPLKYTDPSGWVMQGALMGNPSQGVVDYTSVFMEPVHGISDFNNAYYKTNMAIYGNMDGPCGRGLFASGGMGCEAAYQAAMDHYSSASPGMVWSIVHLINNYDNNPSTLNRRDLIDAGVINYMYRTWWTAEGKGGYQYSFELKHGTYRYGNDNYNFGYKGASDIIIRWCDLSKNVTSRNDLGKANMFAQVCGVPMGAISEGFEMAAKSYHGVPLSKAFSGLSKAQYVSALTKEGNVLMKTTKALGVVGAGISSYVSLYNMVYYYSNGGTGNEVWMKTSLDVGMIALGVFGGPIGLAVSIGYLVLDLSTDGFGVSYQIKP